MAPPFQPQQFIASHVRDIPRSGIREFFDIVQSMPEVISLGVGEPDFVTPWHIREAAIYALERGKTGYTSNLGLMKFAEVVLRHKLLVITDEIYAELTFEGEHVSIASLPGMRERTVFLHGFSKAYAMTGFRVGYACGPAEIIEAMMKIHQHSMLCASIISQEAALEAIQHGEADTAEMRDEKRLRSNFVVNAFNAMGLTCHLPRGSF